MWSQIREDMIKIVNFCCFWGVGYKGKKDEAGNLL